MKAVFTTKRTVTANEIDDLNHVNNVAYIQWMDAETYKPARITENVLKILEPSK